MYVQKNILNPSNLIFDMYYIYSIIKHLGGETDALRRMTMTITERPAWVCQFQKPETSPNALEPSTTVCIM